PLINSLPHLNLCNLFQCSEASTHNTSTIAFLIPKIHPFPSLLPSSSTSKCPRISIRALAVIVLKRFRPTLSKKLGRTKITKKIQDAKRTHTLQYTKPNETGGKAPKSPFYRDLLR